MCVYLLRQSGIQRVQVLADISHSALCCHSNETRAPIANLPNTAQLEALPTIPCCRTCDKIVFTIKVKSQLIATNEIDAADAAADNNSNSSSADIFKVTTHTH